MTDAPSKTRTRATLTRMKGTIISACAMLCFALPLAAWADHPGQAQLVSDIASAYGKHAELGREQMLWCLFRHTSAQAFRDLVVRLGDRLIFRRVSYGVIERVAKQIGVKVTQRALGEGLSRWMPVIGAIGVGGYAYYDTRQVAATAIAMLESEISTDEPVTQEVRATQLH